MSKEKTGYDLSRSWFNFCFENPDKIAPNHTALYFFAIEHCNRLGWKTKFGLPTTMAMEAIGIRSYNTYKKTLTELVEFGFIKMVEISKNQYSSNIVALSNFNKAHDKALDKALIKHTSKQSESTVQSIDSIDKQVTINKEQEGFVVPLPIEFSIEECLTVAMNDPRWVKANKATKEKLQKFNDVLEERGVYNKNPMDYKTHYANYKRTGKLDNGPPGVTSESINDKIKKSLKEHAAN